MKQHFFSYETESGHVGGYFVKQEMDGEHFSAQPVNYNHVQLPQPLHSSAPQTFDLGTSQFNGGPRSSLEEQILSLSSPENDIDELLFPDFRNQAPDLRVSQMDQKNIIMPDSRR